MTGAGGDGGPRGIFLLILQLKIFTLICPVIVSVPYLISYFHNRLIFGITHLNFGGSKGSTCASTILITLCFAPELNDWPCCDGV